MAEKVRLFYNNKQMPETMGCNGVLIAVEKFDNRTQAEKMIEFYKTVYKSDE